MSQPQYTPLASDESEKLVQAEESESQDESHLLLAFAKRRPGTTLVRVAYALSTITIAASAANLVAAIMVRSANEDVPLNALPRPDIFAGLSL